MTASFGSRLQRAHANAVHAVERRSPQASNTASDAATTAVAASSQTTTDVPVATIPHDTKALIAVISVLAAVILGIVIWRIWAWRNRRLARQSGSSSNEKRNSSGKVSLFGLSDVESYERPRTIVLDVPRPNEEAIWVPQVRPWNPVTRKTELADVTVTAPTPSPPASSNTSIRTPPPIYVPGQTAKTSEFPADSHLAPPSALKLKSEFDADTPITPSVRNTMTVASPASPARTASFAYQQQQLPAPGHVRRSSSSSSRDSAKDPQRLPRTMVVAQTFAPSMGDELTIAVGERIRMMDEYADGWCLVERGAERGVIPRFCLVERERRSVRTGRSPPPAVTPPSSGGI